MSTDHLQIPLPGTGSSDKIPTYNEAFQLLENAVTEKLSYAWTTDADKTLTNAQALESMLIELTGSEPSSNRYLNVPTEEKLYIVRDATSGGGLVTVRPTGGTGVVLDKGVWTMVHSDGTDITEIPMAGTGVGGASTVCNKALATLSGDDSANISDGEAIAFDTLDGNEVGITLDANGRFTLPAGSVYLLFGSPLPTFSGATGVVTPQWYDVTDSAYVGVLGEFIANTAATTHQPCQGQVVAFVDTSDGDHDVELRINGAPTVLTLWQSAHSVVAIQQLAGGGQEPFRGARVRLSSDEEVANDTNEELAWDAASKDTDSFWSAGSPTRLTIPAGSGITKVILRAGVSWEADTGGYRKITFLKNSADFEGNGISQIAALDAAAAGDNPAHVVTSTVLDVSETDFFELRVRHTGGAPLDVRDTNATWFELEVVPDYAQVAAPPFRGAVLKLTANEAIDANAVIDWDAAITDTDGFWSAGTPSRLTIPVGSGITRVRLYFNVRWDGSANNDLLRWVYMQKNGANFAGQGMAGGPTLGGTDHTPQDGISAIIDVVEGDYFWLRAFETSTGVPEIMPDEDSHFTLEVIEARHMGASMKPHTSHDERTGGDVTYNTTETDLTSLTAIDIPGANGAREYEMSCTLGILDDGTGHTATLMVYVGTNGAKAGGGGELIYDVDKTLVASELEMFTVVGLRFTPAIGDKIGLTLTATAVGVGHTMYGGTAAAKKSWMKVQEVLEK